MTKSKCFQIRMVALTLSLAALVSGAVPAFAPAQATLPALQGAQWMAEGESGYVPHSVVPKRFGS